MPGNGSSTVEQNFPNPFAPWTKSFSAWNKIPTIMKQHLNHQKTNLHHHGTKNSGLMEQNPNCHGTVLYRHGQSPSAPWNKGFKPWTAFSSTEQILWHHRTNSPAPWNTTRSIMKLPWIKILQHRKKTNNNKNSRK